LRLVRFHRDLYAESAVSEAVAVFAPHGLLDRQDEPSHWVVQISGATPQRERRVAGALANYALGLTVKGRRR
jgi:hypothetical protein